MIKPKKTLISANGYDIPEYIDKTKLKLDSNENLIGPSVKVIEAIKNITDNDIKYYPAYGELVRQIARYNNLDNSMILPTNGADDAIKVIFDTFIDAQDTVLNSNPTFVMPKIYAIGVGCTYKEFICQEKWAYPVDDIIANIDESTKLVIVTTPNNPTGEAISEQQLLKILDAAKNSLVLLDETYSNYAKEQFTHLIKKYENLVIIRSMSKDFALAGLRLGYIIADSQIINNFKKIISPYNVNNIAVIAGIAALNDESYINMVKSLVDESKAIITKGFSNIAKKIYPSEANFLLIDFGEKAEFVYKRLLSANIEVKSFIGSKLLDNCLRITMPHPDQAKMIVDVVNKKRDLIIFDMDGVLIDTSNSYRLAIKETYQYFSGKPLLKQSIQDAKNIGGLNNDWDLTLYLLKQDGFDVSPNRLIDKFQELYFGESADGFINNEEILIEPDVLMDLSKTYDLAIFTGRPKSEALFALKKWGIANLFSVIITMDDIPDGYHKPHPYGVSKILQIISPVKTYYLGDTIDDMSAAKQGGVNGIGILPPQDKSCELRESLIAYGAKYVLDETYKLPEYLKSIGY